MASEVERKQGEGNRARFTVRMLLFEIIAFFVFALLAAAAFIAWRLSQGPIDLELIRPQVEQALSNARGGDPVTIDQLVLEWSRESNRVEAAARGLTALEESGDSAFRAERAVVSLDAASLLGGKIKTTRLRLERGSASVVRSADGVWTLADIELVREPPSGDLLEALRALDWPTLATPIRALISAGSFEYVELADFRIFVEDEKASTRWQAYPVAGVWRANPDGVSLDLDMQLVGRSDPNRVRILLNADGEVSTASGRLALEGVDPLGLATVFGYGGDDFESTRPANAEFEIAASEAAGLTSARLSLSDVTGRGALGGLVWDVRSLAISAAFDPESRSILIDRFAVDSERMGGAVSARFDIGRVLDGELDEAIPFEIAGNDFSLSAQPVFEDVWRFEAADVAGTIDLATRRMDFSRISLSSGGFNVDGAAELWLARTEDGGDQLGAKVEATATGAATKETVLAFWPVGLGADGRDWVRDNILAGDVTSADFVMDWPPGANAQGFLPNEHLTLEFDVERATVQIMDDLPPARNVTARGHMEGNSLRVDVTSGSMSRWRVDDAEVELPRFHPKGAEMKIVASGQGPFLDLMQVLDRSELNIGEEYGLQIEGMSGEGGLEVEFIRPMLRDVPDEDLRYTISGGFQNASAPQILGDFALTNSDVRAEVTQDGLSISGAGRLGPAPVVFDWSERFLDDEDVAAGEVPSNLVVSARVTPDLLNEFGIAARNFMQGEAVVEMRAGGSGRDFSTIVADVDLTPASLEIPEFGWRKEYDEPARGTIRYAKNAMGVGVATGDIRADGLELLGDMTFTAAGELDAVGIERIFSRGNVDLRGGLSRRSDGGFVLDMRGPMFDASPWMDTFLSMSGADGDAAESEQADLQIRLDADRIRLREEATLLDATVDLVLDGEGPRQGRINGRISEGKAVDVRIEPDGESRRISLRSDDAGFGAKVLLKLDNLVGGSLVVDGVFTDGVGNAVMTMTDVRLTEAPMLTQMLSLASLRGLSDVLSGDGILFSRVETPLRLTEGRIDIVGLRASGPAMGLTARGWVSPQDEEISLDGVLVPSFGVNSALGGLPIIGDLFVSRQGEGIFAPTYSVRGEFSRARVAVNPIAAVTPGVLRRIFENPEQPPPLEPEVSDDTRAEPPPVVPNDRPDAPRPQPVRPSDRPDTPRTQSAPSAN